MFVIDGVELELGDQVADIWRFDHGNTIRLEHLLDPADKLIGIGNVGEHVVGVYDIGKLPLCGESSSKILIEELDQRWNPFRRDSELGDVGGGFDAENRNPLRLVELQQISIIACHLDDQACGTEAMARDERLDQRARVLDHGVGERGGIGVVAKQPFR